MADKPTYLRIKPEYLFRGWKGLPYALVSREGGDAAFMTPEVFHMARFCNGRFEEDSIVFSGERRKYLNELDKLGFLERLDEPGNLLPDQEYVTYENRYLKMVFWSLTGHCNYRCRHCYMSAPHAIYPQPTTEQCLDVVDQIAACGIRRVGVTGGEPLVRRDFLQIVDRMIEKGIQLVTVMTNGALVDEKLLDELAARNCRPEFHMSFDGTKRWHDWLRGVDGAYDSVRRALTLCHERGFTTGCGVVLHKGNVGMLRDIVNELGALGVSSVKVNRLNCVGEGTALTDYAITAQEEYDTYLEYLPRYIEDGMPVPILMLSEVFTANQGKFSISIVRHPEDKDCSRKPICAAARNTMYLGPDGRILPCIPMAEQDCTSGVFPTIADMTLAEALSDSFYMDFITTTLGAYLEHNPECAACAYKNRCGGGCRGQAVMANGGSDLLGIDPSACLVFKGGYYDRVMEFIERYQGKA